MGREVSDVLEGLIVVSSALLTFSAFHLCSSLLYQGADR